jgi:hypothetical protein
MTTVPLKKVINFPHKFRSHPGCCIYCGSAGDPDLHDEHIIPDSVSGKIEFLKASCRECADKTGAVEGRVVSRLYGDARAYLRMRRGHRRKWPNTFKARYIPREQIKSEDEPLTKLHAKSSGFLIKEVPLDDHPATLVSLNLPYAGMLMGYELNDDNFKPLSLNVSAPPDFKDRARRLGGVGRIMVGGAGRLEREDFGLFLAKIAHAYATAQLGLGSFIPFLTKAIRNERPMYLSHYIGAAIPHLPINKTEHLHRLTIADIKLPPSGEKYVLVRVQLFAVDEQPAYDVIVGRVTNATHFLSGTHVPIVP